ncbi:MAG: hypothetical protein WC306_03965, partial [Candidatus Paceibacterota bacterium]
MKRYIKRLIVLALLAMAGISIVRERAYTQFIGGNGAGWGTAVSSSAVLNTLSEDADTKLIRAGQTVAYVERNDSGVSTITLSSAYPNNNLKAGQRILVDIDDNSFDGVFTITEVLDQQHFTYSQPSAELVVLKEATGSAGGHYTTLTAWEAGQGGDLVSAAKIKVAECYNDWDGGLTDNLTLSGSTTSSSYYLKISVPQTERNTGATNTGFKLNGTLGIQDSYAVIENMEVGGLATLTGASVTAAGNMLFSGGIEFASSATLNAGSSNMVISSAFTFPVGSVFNAQGARVTFNNCSVAFHLGTFNPATSTLAFSGASSWVPKPGVSYNVVEFGTGTTTISSATATIANKLVLDTGASGAVNGSNISLKGDLVCLSGTGGTTAITLNGTLPQSISNSAGTIPAVIVAGTLDLRRDETESGNAFNFTSLTVNSAGVINAIGNTNSPYGAGVKINTGAFTLNSGGYLNADGRGFSPVAGPGKGLWSGSYGSGAGHAGSGGGTSVNGGGLSYGSITKPVSLGSGGGSNSIASGYGGGAVELNVSGAAAVNGAISVNGLGGSHGGASGGSIWLNCGAFSGSGTISANGANAVNTSHGGGSGGRIRLEYTDKTFTGTVTATGGTGYEVGASGEISEKDTDEAEVTPSAPVLSHPADEAAAVPAAAYLKFSSTDANQDYLRYKIEIATKDDFTEGPYIGATAIDQTSSQAGWLNQTEEAGSAYASGKAAVHTLQTPLSDNTQYYWRAYAIDPAGSNAWSAASTSRSFTTGTGGSVNIWTNASGDGLWLTDANWLKGTKPAAGEHIVFSGSYNADCTFDVYADLSGSLASLTLESGYTRNITLKRVDTAGPGVLTVTGDITFNGGNIICVGNTSAVNAAAGGTAEVPYGEGIQINAANITVAEGVSINADAKGFICGAGPGKGAGSRYVSPAGGGYGGNGGDNGRNAGGLSYGSSVAPTALGSGGNSDSGGFGGGAFKLIVSGTATINGTLSAVGGTGASGFSGGAGGSVWISSGVLAGAGSISVNGGTNTNPGSGAGGGGGRIRLEYADNTFTGTITFTGGIGNQTGEAGTILEDNTSSNTAPSAPSLSYPANAVTLNVVNPGFVLSTVDSDYDYLKYKIEIATKDDFTEGPYIGANAIDQTSSQAGWFHQTEESRTAYDSIR